MSTVNRMTTRGTSYAHHGVDLATALYRPFDRWCLDHYGFTIDDVLHIGETVQALLTVRMNSLRGEALDFAERVQTHVSSPAARDKLTADESAKRDSPETPVMLAQRAFIHVYEHGVREVMSFTPDDLIDAGLSQDRVGAVLKELLPFGGKPRAGRLRRVIRRESPSRASVLGVRRTVRSRCAWDDSPRRRSAIGESLYGWRVHVFEGARKDA